MSPGHGEQEGRDGWGCWRVDVIEPRRHSVYISDSPSVLSVLGNFQHLNLKTALKGIQQKLLTLLLLLFAV
jgi:hypothetical protein